MKKTMTIMECNQALNSIRGKFIAVPVLMLAGLVKLMLSLA